MIYTHGASQSNPGPAIIRVQLCTESGSVLQELSESIGNATDEYAEYFAVMRSLQLAGEMFSGETKKKKFKIHLSGEMTKRQLNREVVITHPGLVPLFIEIHNLRVTSFPHLSFVYLRT